MPPPPPTVALASFGEPTPETLAFNAKIAAMFEGAPGPEEVDIDVMRALRAAGKGLLPIDGPIAEARWLDVDAAAHGAPGGPGRMRVVAPDDPPRGVYLYFHGGGWTFGSPEQHDGFNLAIARAAGVEVLGGGYRLAPEHPWPACAEDAAAATRFALARAEAAGLPFFIGGASAGAHLAAVALQRLKAEGRLDRVAGAVLVYGAFDMRLSPSAAAWGDRAIVLSTPIIEWFIGNLLPERSLARSAAVSPLLADWTGAPPAHFQIGTVDPLLDDTLFMAERWRAAGARAELAVFAGAIHAFDVFVAPEHGLPIAAEAQTTAADFLDRRLKELGR